MRGGLLLILVESFLGCGVVLSFRIRTIGIEAGEAHVLDSVFSVSRPVALGIPSRCLIMVLHTFLNLYFDDSQTCRIVSSRCLTLTQHLSSIVD